MSERWVLNRAGIVNVYQYADEILCFGGGRLLLRGVNGSGKSTAMNMLLPFLLDGDTRKVDAAGEQSGVLESWMLSGRDDAQPIGYLWIEFVNGGEFLTCGCGIRANRSSDTVSRWWWITPRRPAIDLDLVQDGRPLTAEGLRAVIGAEAVFRQEYRRAYREEVRRRLYGGADIDQHIRLLHIVRSPRVGDRIDQDLASYLHDALPHLSETALSDAAQPLDDLEEHRHNVAELARTSLALTAIHEVYAGYCRSELRRRADRAHELAEAADRSRRAVSGAAADLREADAKLEAAGAAVRAFETRLSELRVQIRSLHDLPAYQEGRQFEDLRNHVGRSGAHAGLVGQLLGGRAVAVTFPLLTFGRTGGGQGFDRRAAEASIRAHSPTTSVAWRGVRARASNWPAYLAIDCRRERSSWHMAESSGGGNLSRYEVAAALPGRRPPTIPLMQASNVCSSVADGAPTSTLFSGLDEGRAPNGLRPAGHRRRMPRPAVSPSLMAVASAWAAPSSAARL